MKKKQYTILYVDDEAPNLRAFERSFRFDFEVLTALSGREALEKLAQNEVHLILTDQRMPEMNGLEFLKEAVKINPSAVRIILTAYSDSEVLLKAIQEGKVFDYVLKPWRREAILERLQKAIEFYSDQVEKVQRLQSRIDSLEEDLKAVQPWQDLVGAHGGLEVVTAQVRKVAPTDSTVLIRGESGTGKELMARAIHENSPRKEGPFIKVNANAFAPGLLESELFGHEKGSFTGASQLKRGRFELAGGGTLFLDEIGDLPEAVQVKLLRVLQEQEFERVGGTRPLRADIRLLTATHRPMELLVEEGRFREDLFYRLNVIPLWIPPLRERQEDIEELLQFFLSQFNRKLGKKVSFSPEASQALKNYPWPGNVRELKNIVERSVVLAEWEELIPLEFLSSWISREVPPETLPPYRNSSDLKQSLKNQEQNQMLQMLQKTQGNLSEAARRLGLPRTTLYSRLKKA